jgi:hypothetical protein
MVALQSLLAPQTLTKVISQQAATSDWLATMFGCQPGGKNELNYGHAREGSFHIYNNVRKVAAGRAPGAAAGRRAANPIGRVEFSYPRMHDSVEMLAEVLHNLGRITDPAERDAAGADMIRRQTSTLAQLAANWRKAMLIGHLRDDLHVVFTGDDVYFTYDSAQAGASPLLKAEARLPAANKAQLNMLGGGNIISASWATDTTDIPGHLMAINAAFQQLCGGHLHACICPFNVWNAVIKNEHVAAIHGSANAPFLSFERDSLDPVIANTMRNVFRARLSVLPDVTWYITDEGIEVGSPGSETFQKIVPNDHVLFVGHRPDDGTVACYQGSEPVAEYDGGPESVRVGLSSWSVKRSNPTKTDIFVLDNALAVSHVPLSRAYARVIGF